MAETSAARATQVPPDGGTRINSRSELWLPPWSWIHTGGQSLLLGHGTESWVSGSLADTYDVSRLAASVAGVSDGRTNEDTLGEEGSVSSV